MTRRAGLRDGLSIVFINSSWRAWVLAARAEGLSVPCDTSDGVAPVGAWRLHVLFVGFVDVMSAGEHLLDLEDAGLGRNRQY